MAEAAAAPWRDHDPLALDPHWRFDPPLLPLHDALEQTLLASGLSRNQVLQQLLAKAPVGLRLPLLALLPRSWRNQQAQLPQQLRQLGGLLGGSLLSPTLLAALVDDLAHLLPALPASQAGALERWRRSSLDWNGRCLPLPTDLPALLAAATPSPPGAKPLPEGLPDELTDGPQTSGRGKIAAGPALLARLSGGLHWHNQGLQHDQSEACRLANQQLAQVLNRLAANLLEPAQQPCWRFSGCDSGAALIQQLIDDGFTIRARLRASIASFGFGASLIDADGLLRQVPLALPLRTGLLNRHGEEQTSLLPHAALELELRRGERIRLRLQYYQGSEGLCGWQGLNDLPRAWQNDPDNGTVRYPGEPFAAGELPLLLALCEVIALLHNSQADALQLRVGGYGTLGFCLDSTGLLQQAMHGRCDLYPLLLGGPWRERLEQAAAGVAGSLADGQAIAVPGGSTGSAGRWTLLHREALARYRQALADLPLDLAPRQAERQDSWRRLLACRPQLSPFRLVQELPALAPPGASAGSRAATTAATS